MRTIIVGMGEIGRGLLQVFNHEEIILVDKENEPEGKGDVMHICFPYSDKFISEVERYKKLYEPKYVVIHSTVPVGTSRKLGAIHSPVIGIHPHLAQSMFTFTKYLGGEANEVADYFRRHGIKVYLFDRPETTELMKILSTTFYGVCIEYIKDVKDQCKKFDVPFEAWTLWTQNYNQGYARLGYPEYSRPNLIPIKKKIGGHCVRENSELLETKFTKLIKDCNDGIRIRKFDYKRFGEPIIREIVEEDGQMYFYLYDRLKKS